MSVAEKSPASCGAEAEEMRRAVDLFRERVRSLEATHQTRKRLERDATDGLQTRGGIQRRALALAGPGKEFGSCGRLVNQREDLAEPTSPESALEARR